MNDGEILWMGTIERIAVGVYPLHGVTTAVHMALHRRETEAAEMADAR
jgi:hypothetical protein